jgi:DNA-binding NarL/FixJ family response regulator
VIDWKDEIHMDTERKIKVLIVDDYDLVRDSLTALFEAFEDLEVVGATGDGHKLLSLCSTYQPDIVLMDMFMPTMDGVEATRLIRREFPHIKVVVLSMFTDYTLICDALNAGAISYLSKTRQLSEVTKSVRDAYYGIW